MPADKRVIYSIDTKLIPASSSQTRTSEGDTLEYDDQNACLSEGIQRSIPETSAKNYFELTPNPTSTQFKLLFCGKNAGVFHLGITDNLGKEVFNKVIYNIEEGYTVNVEHLTPGLYQVQLMLSDGTILNKKLIILK